MSATTSPPPLRAVPFRAPTARLALKPVSPSPGHVELDGAWWPRSPDLTHELSALAGVLDPLWGRITHIAVNPHYWPTLPRKILVNGHVVEVGWFTSEQDPHKILLLSYTAGRWEPLVIPPETGAPSAARLMAAASANTGPPTTAAALNGGGTGRRNFLVVRGHHGPARPADRGDLTVVVAEPGRRCPDDSPGSSSWAGSDVATCRGRHERFRGLLAGVRRHDQQVPAPPTGGEQDNRVRGGGRHGPAQSYDHGPP